MTEAISTSPHAATPEESATGAPTTPQDNNSQANSHKLGAAAPHAARAEGFAALGPDNLPHRAGVAWHYGDPLGEQRAPRVVIDRSNLSSVMVSGTDAVEYVNNLFSQKLIDAAPGTMTELLNLDAQGHVLEHAHTLVGQDFVLLTTDSAHTRSLMEYLERMKFWNDVTVEELPLGVVTLLGDPTADPVVETRALGEIARTCGATTHPATITQEQLRAAHSPIGGIVRPHMGQARPRVDIFLPHASTMIQRLQDAGLAPAGLLTFEVHRVFSLEPQVGVDTDEKTIPHEHAQWIGSAVHLDKGCYRGQETVARVHNIGRSPRVLVRLFVDGSVPVLPTTSTPITSGGRTVGRLGTIVHDHEWGPVALGVLKRSAVNRSNLAAGDAALTVDMDSVPQDDPGAQAGRLAQQRLRGHVDFPAGDSPH